MKKILTIILIILIVFTAIYFIVKVSSKDILNKILGDTNTKIEDKMLISNKLVNKKVPFFDLPTIDGKRIKLSEFTNKPFVVIFFASWNVESASQLKILDEYLSSTRKEDKIVKILTIDSQEEMSVIKSFIRRGGYQVPVIVDTKGDVGESFNIKSLPTVFFVDRNGIIREVYSGVLNKVTLVDKIEQLIN